MDKCERKRINGEGTRFYEDKKVYIGKFEDGDRSEGTLTWPNGLQYKGKFSNDKFDGESKLIFPDGSYYQTKFQNG